MGLLKSLKKIVKKTVSLPLTATKATVKAVSKATGLNKSQIYGLAGLAGVGALTGGAGVGALGATNALSNTADASGASGGNSSGFLGSLFSSLTGNSGGSFLGGLLNTGLGLAGSYATSIFNTEQQEKLQDKAFANDLKMWNMQNEYNTPLAQMQRYQQAGLNPNLIYGNGVSSAGNASGAPSYEPVRFHGIDLNSIMMFQQLENLNSQNRLLEAQTQQALAMAKNTQADNVTKVVNASNAQSLVDADLSIKRATQREIDARAGQIERGDNLGWKAWARSAFIKFKRAMDSKGYNIVPKIVRE